MLPARNRESAVYRKGCVLRRYLPLRTTFMEEGLCNNLARYSSTLALDVPPRGPVKHPNVL